MNDVPLSTQEMTKQVDVLGQILVRAKKKYVISIEKQEQSDADTILHTLDTEHNGI